MNTFALKSHCIKKRGLFYLKQFPVRVIRFFKQLIKFDFSFGIFQGFILYFASIGLCFLDLFAVPEVYETIMDLCKWNTRALTKRERLISTIVYTDSIDLDMVRIDERAVIGPKWGRFAYVSYHTINSYGKIPDAIFVHELMHIWQFTHLGSVYIINALMAQRSKEGYDYKGLERMHDVINEGKSILAFNYEQQADIICDYFRIVEGKKAQWSSAGLADIDSYQYFLNQVQNPRFLGLG